MSQQNEMKRRNFLKNSALGLLGASFLHDGNLAFSQNNTNTGTPAVSPETGSAKIKEYRVLGRTGFKASDISTGGPRNEALLNAILDTGVNYIDTAESYGRGLSETVTGNVLKNRDRKSIFVTTKLAIKKDDTKETILKRTRDSLGRLQMDYVDCLMMHNPATVEILNSEAFHQAAKQLKSEGKIKHIGISNHGSQWGEKNDSMEKVCLAMAADGRFDVLLFVFNFVLKESGERILKACKEKNIGVTLMKTNPVAMYMETLNNVENLKKEGKEVPPRMTEMLTTLKSTYEAGMAVLNKLNAKNPSEMRDAAIKFTLSYPEVHTVCCSFENFDDIDPFIKLSAQKFSNAEMKKLAAYTESFGPLYCRHACGMCEAECPQKVPVNTIMRYNHYFTAQNREKYAMQKYAELTTPRADNCMNCAGYCQSACPYGVQIHGLLTLAHQRLILA